MCRRHRLPLLRPLQWAAICVILCAAGVGVIMLHPAAFNTPAQKTWLDMLTESEVPPAIRESLPQVSETMKRVNQHLDEELNVLSLIEGELNELDQIVGAPELERKKSSQWGMTSKAKSPSAPPTAPRPREIPHFGDPNGLSKVDLVDPANMSPIPVLMIACNRVEVKRALDRVVESRWSAERFPIIISQDCLGSAHHAETKEVLDTYVVNHGATLYQQMNITDPLEGRSKKEKKWSGYYKIARHYKFALDKVFAHPARYDSVIIMEDDLDVASDIFEFFAQGRELLRADPTLFCVSAWNDNGKSQHVADPHRLYRTDFFPGLGWMILRSLWDDELGPKWTDRYWDDWVRLPEQRNGRACIRPEVSRTRTFGAKGVSKGQFFNKYLKFIKLNEEHVNFLATNVSYLLKHNYDNVNLRWEWDLGCPCCAMHPCRVAALRVNISYRMVVHMSPTSKCTDIIAHYMFSRVACVVKCIEPTNCDAWCGCTLGFDEARAVAGSDGLDGLDIVGLQTEFRY
eukprot:m.110122 g.110122  ORF g.110122 m.110122 type:complete len:515 (-) comp21302_c0_seq7:1413-2957(-)